MFDNDTAEPGLEEVATRLTQEEFLADGRVRIVRKQDADLILKCKIKEYHVAVDHLSGDDIPSRSEILITTELALFDPFDPKVPIAQLGVIESTSTANTDTRSQRYDVKSDANEDALRQMARQVVAKTITGFPTQLRDIPDGVTIPNQGGPVSAEQQQQQDRRRTRFPFF